MSDDEAEAIQTLQFGVQEGSVQRAGEEDNLLVGLTSRGEFGFAPGGVREHMNFLDGHIEAVAHYLGMEERHIVHVEYQEFSGDRHARSLKDGETNTVALAETLARTFTAGEKVA